MMERNKRAIVTGGAGFIGSHVVDLLIENDWDVLVVDNMSTGKRENIHRYAHSLKVDIQDPRSWELIKQTYPNFTHVFHLAALARIQPSIKDPVTAHDANVNGTLQVLEYCRETGAKLIFSGSSSIYEGVVIPTREGDDKKPKSPYAMQKLMCEQYIRLYHELYDLDYTVLRYFNVYGERQITDGAYAAIVGIFLNRRKEGKPLTITNDGEQMRDFTYVKDVARANLLGAGKSVSGTFNVGTGKSYSINELAARVGGEVEYIGDRQGEAQMTRADNSKLRAKRWKPTKDIMDWIDENRA